MNGPSITGLWQHAIVVMSRSCTRSTYLPYFVGSTHRQPRAHGTKCEQPQAVVPEVLIEIGDRHLGSGSGVANVSTAQYTPVVGSYRPRVVGESNTGGRIACSVRSPTSNDSPCTTQRQRSQREVEAVRVAFDHRPVAHERRVRTRRQRLVEVAGVIDVVVREEDPRTSSGSTSENTSSSHCLRFAGVPGVDDDRLRAEDHHRVDVHVQRLTERGLDLMDHVRVLGDLRRRHGGGRRKRGERHVGESPSVITRTTMAAAAHHSCITRSAAFEVMRGYGGRSS